MKKTLLKLSSITLIAAPAALAISCGSNKESNSGPYLHFETGELGIQNYLENITLPDGATATTSDLEMSLVTLRHSLHNKLAAIEQEIDSIHFLSPQEMTQKLITEIYKVGYATTEYNIFYKKDKTTFHEDIDFSVILDVPSLNAMNISESLSQREQYLKLKEWSHKAIYRLENDFSSVYTSLIETAAYKAFIREIPTNHNVSLLVGDATRSIPDVSVNATKAQIEKYFQMRVATIPPFVEN